VKIRNIRYNTWHQRLKPQQIHNKSATGSQQLSIPMRFGREKRTDGMNGTDGSGNALYL
jgi:hypothetical protein